MKQDTEAQARQIVGFVQAFSNNTDLCITVVKEILDGQHHNEEPTNEQRIVLRGRRHRKYSDELYRDIIRLYAKKDTLDFKDFCNKITDIARHYGIKRTTIHTIAHTKKNTINRLKKRRHE